MLNNPKRAIWEALLLAGLVFFLGFLLGFAFESSQTNKMNEYYIQSEFYLLDSIALNSAVDIGMFNCPSLCDSYSLFADRVYQEAILLQKYEDAEKITEEMKLVHRRYDLLRTFLWANLMKTSFQCKEAPDIFVYLYEYNTEDLAKKATQNVWSKILADLKQEKGNKLLLIPIASDLNITSLNVLTGSFNISEYPVLIINNKEVISELTSLEELKKHLN
jgi:hypothetical protein